MAHRKFLAGNWKMNGLSASVSEIDAIIEGASSAGWNADLLICPPFPLIAGFAAKAQGTPLSIGAQDCHAGEKGAHTGDVSAPMLKDVGATHVILGHSERRADHGESDADVKAKAEAAMTAGLSPIICCGESEAERDAGNAEAVVVKQLEGSLPGSLEGVTVAYEPIWAIGTGRVPSNDDIAAMHSAIRALLDGRGGQDVRILYGGSMKPSNADEILAIAHVDGGLIGGASLKADDFLGIVAAA